MRWPLGRDARPRARARAPRSYDNTTNILTLDDGSGTPDCMYMQISDPHHIKVAVMDTALPFASCDPAHWHSWTDQPACKGSQDAGTFIANKIAWLTKQA